MLFIKRQVLHAHKTAQAVNLPPGRHLFVLKAKPPGIDQWGNSHIESTGCLLVNVNSQLEYLLESVVKYGTLPLVKTRDYRRIVEHRELGIHFVKLRLNLLTQVTLKLIGRFIDRTENHALSSLIGHGTLLTDNQHSTYNEQQQEGNLPEQTAST